MSQPVQHEFIFDEKFAKFPPGSKVQVISRGVDFMFFDGDETGIVSRNYGKYLGIIVKFDEPIKYRNWNKDIIECKEWNFNPEDLKVIQ